MGFKTQFSHEVHADMDKVINKGANLTKKDHDEEMLDENEDIAIAKVIQASLGEAKAEKTKAHLTALQKAMGVSTKPAEIFAAADSDIGAEEDGFMEPGDPDEDGENDVTMGEGDEHEIAHSCFGGGGDNDGDKV
jgi:hypothetical protein